MLVQGDGLPRFQRNKEINFRPLDILEAGSDSLDNPIPLLLVQAGGRKGRSVDEKKNKKLTSRLL